MLNVQNILERIRTDIKKQFEQVPFSRVVIICRNDGLKDDVEKAIEHIVVLVLLRLLNQMLKMTDFLVELISGAIPPYLEVRHQVKIDLSRHYLC